MYLTVLLCHVEDEALYSVVATYHYFVDDFVKNGIKPNKTKTGGTRRLCYTFDG